MHATLLSSALAFIIVIANVLKRQFDAHHYDMWSDSDHKMAFSIEYTIQYIPDI